MDDVRQIIDDVRRLDPAAIRARIGELERETRALRTLLVAAQRARAGKARRKGATP